MNVSVVDPYELARLRSDHAALRFEWELIKCAAYDRKYRPDQLRHLRGEPFPGSFAYEGRDRALVHRAFYQAAAPLVTRAITAGIAFYLGLSNQRKSDSRTIITFNAKSYGPNEKGTIDLRSVESLDRDEVGSACPRLGEVQERTDAATELVRSTRGDLRPAEFGTAVHSNLKRQIDNLDDPNFRAEVSYLKEREDDYGKKGSVRIDVLEKVRDGTVCVYDIKTGKSGLSIRRTGEIAENVFNAYPGTTRIVVTEVRPTR